MVLCGFARPKRLLYLLIFCLFAGVFVVIRSKHEEDSSSDLNILPVLGVTLPNLDEYEYLPGTAKPCTTSPPFPKLLIFVHSSPTNIPHREAIRRTWGSSKNGDDIRTVFVVGRSRNAKVWERIQREADQFGDLVLLSFLDSYGNLTLKHLSGLRWVLENCPRVRYVLKSDDDIFVDTKRLLTLADSFLGDGSGSSRDSLVCHVIPEGTAPKRTGKWEVTREEYPYEEYPEYCSGLAYFARLATLGRIHDVASSGGVPYLRIDDVFVTGLSASLAGVRRQDLGVRFATTELPVVEWMKGKSVRPCPWMVAEMSPYYWPKDAFRLWNKTVVSWRKLNKNGVQHSTR